MIFNRHETAGRLAKEGQSRGRAAATQRQVAVAENGRGNLARRWTRAHAPALGVEAPVGATIRQLAKLSRQWPW